MPEKLDLTNIDSDNISEALEYYVAVASLLTSDMDASNGSVYRNFVLLPQAILNEGLSAKMNRLRRSRSVAAIQEDPTLATESDVDNLASTFGVTRSAGTKATGYLTVVVATNAVLSVSEGTTLTGGGLSFVTTHLWTGLPTTSAGLAQSDYDRVMTLRSDGNYEFTIQVEASAVGAVYNIAADTPFTWTDAPTWLVSMSAAGDFTGGDDADTNDEVVTAMLGSLSYPSVANRTSTEALLRSQFADIQDMSIVGFGDPGLLRDSHNLFGLSVPGKADIYVRTSYSPVVSQISVTGEKQAGADLWRINLTRAQSSGVYYVKSVSRGGVAKTISSTIRSYDSTICPLNYIYSVDESAYSGLQTLSVIVEDTGTDQAYTYTVELVAMPDIVDIHDYLYQRSVRPVAGDYLVKAPIPMFVGLTITLYQSTTVAVDTDAIEAAARTAVNTVPFGYPALLASRIVDACRDLLPSGVDISPNVGMLGSLYRPDGTIDRYYSTDALSLPDETGTMITARTTRFFTLAGSVAINTQAINAVEA